MTRTCTVARAAPRDKRGAGRRAALAVALALALAGPVSLPLAAQDVPPDEPWRTLETPHFRVTFPAPLEPLARRAGALAEDARARLEPLLADAPRSTVELVLTDHADIANGFAEIAPYPRIVVFARPPIDGFALSHFDDWLELVVTHELAHIHHLELSGVPGRVLRSVFGRVPAQWPFFPSYGAPQWTLEGLATWYETRMTGTGRVEGTYLDMMLRAAALEDRFEPLDRASGRSPAWPGGQRAYAYGSLFFEWLLARHGEARMVRFVDAVAGQWVPYRLNAAARSAFGVSFDDAWSQWRAERRAGARALADTVAGREPRARLEPLTEGARLALHGRVGPGGTLVYARNDGRSDSHLRFRPLDGGAAADAGGGVRRVRTNGVASVDWTPDGALVAAQLEVVRRTRAFNDLYRVEPDGSVRRLTEGQRLDQPSVTPDGRSAVAVQMHEGRTRLVRVSLAGEAPGQVEPLAALPEGVHWGFPAVSPDGRRVAAVAWRPGWGADLVVLDASDGRLLRSVTSDQALETAPTWAPDGTLLWVSDRTGVANLYAAAPDPETGVPGERRQVTDVVTGVAFPSVDPTGRWIVLSHYGADGWDLARLAYAPGAWADPLPADPRWARAAGQGAGAEPITFTLPADPPADALAPADGPVRPYSPWPTLRPRYWEPVIRAGESARGREVLGPFLGIATVARDVVGRHRAELRAALSTTDARFEGGLRYEFRGWGTPVAGVSLAQGWDAGGPLVAERTDEGGSTTGVLDTLYVRERERRAGADLTVPWNRYRRAWALTVGGSVVDEHRTLLDRDLEPSERYRLSRPRARLGDLRLALVGSTARSHELAAGPSAGWTASLALRSRAELSLADSLDGVVGSDRGFDEALGQLRVYRSIGGPGYAPHVLALRATGGAARGPGADAFHFDVGGASGQSEPISGFALVGSGPVLFEVRGYPEGWRAGRTAWAASAEWRIPLALVNRGWGLVPLHLDRVHGAFFADGGNAWGPTLGIAGYDRPRERAIASVGAELRAEVLTFFSVPLTLRAGVGIPLVDAPSGTPARAYLRLGPGY